MSYIPALDASTYQGNIDWNAVKAAGYQIAIIKMTGGDAGLYTDSKANQNYYAAKRAGLLVAGYHFAGGGNPENEADFFLAAMSPLDADDVCVLDWEIQNANAVDWCRRFIQRLKDRGAPIPMLYINNYTENSLDWSPVVAQSVGLYLANYALSPDDNAHLNHFPTYIMHQYTSSGAVNGIAGRVDLDAWFESLDTFKAYGYRAPVVTPPPNTGVIPVDPTPPPVIVPPTPPTPPETTTTTSTTTTTLPPVDENTKNISWLVKAIKAILKAFHIRSPK